MPNNYDVNYEDERFQQVEKDKQEALTDLEETYGGMIEESDDYYQSQIDASKEWAEKQSQLQQEQTDFAIEEINQQKAQANKDYTKEQSGAYVDWQKQSNRYGANAEAMAAGGMANTGFSESSQVSMYNTYQNRVATARESYNLAIQNYNNSITEARLQNNAVLAEIAYEALQQQLELSLQGFQYKNQLLLEMADKKTEVNNTYYQRYLDVLDQINTENAFSYQRERDEIADQQWKTEYEESVRQFNESFAQAQKEFEESIRQYNQNYEYQKGRDEVADEKWQKEFDESVRQYQQSYELSVQQLQEDIRQFEEQITYYRERDAKEYEMEIKKLEQQKAMAEAELEEEKRQFDETMAFQREQADKKASSSANTSVDKSAITDKVLTGKGEDRNSDSDKAHALNDDTKKGNDNPPIDYKSLADAGYAGLSAAEIDKLVRQGVLEEYEEGGRLKFRLTESAKKQKELYNSLFNTR